MFKPIVRAGYFNKTSVRQFSSTVYVGGFVANRGKSKTVFKNGRVDRSIKTKRPVEKHALSKKDDKNDSKTVKKTKHHEFGDTLRHKFGEVNGLTNVDKLQNIKRTSAKQDTFLDFKILEPVREFFLKEIKERSLLYHHWKVRSPDKELEDPKPTEIQKLSMAELLKERNEKNPYELRIFSIAGETGSGKTYSYLIPLINNLYKDKLAKESKDHGFTTINSVILVPTNELIGQMFNSLNTLSELGLTAVKLDQSSKIEDLLGCNQTVDVLVTTPGKLNMLKKLHLCSGFMQKRLTRTIRYSVMDEADTLLDSSFVKDTMAAIHTMPMLKDLVIVSSTISKLYNKTLENIFGDNRITRICSRKIHRISTKLEMRVIDCSMKPFANSKMNGLKQCLYSIYCDNTEQYQLYKKVLVFANTKESVQKIMRALKTDSAFSNGYELYGVTGGDDAADRGMIMEQFNASAPLESVKNGGKSDGRTLKGIPQSNIKLWEGKEVKEGQVVKVLVTTDILGRGLNFEQTGNAILFDVPRTSADLVNRVGRVGRIGLSGRVFVLVDRGEVKGWVTGLPTVVRNGVPLA